MSLSLSFLNGDRTALVQPVGEHDIATAGVLRQVLLEDCGQARLIVIDFGRTTFIDSTIMGVIVTAHKRLGKGNHRVIGVNALPPGPEGVDDHGHRRAVADARRRERHRGSDPARHSRHAIGARTRTRSAERMTPSAERDPRRRTERRS